MKSENRKNKIFFFGLFFLIFTSVGITYYRYIIALDYFVLLQTSCDPAVESCFLYECDPTAEDAECSENPADDAYYYKKIEKKAYALQSCVENLEGCFEVRCELGEKNCVEMPCDPISEESGGMCYGPGLLLEEESKESEAEEEVAEMTGAGEVGVVEDGAEEAGEGGAESVSQEKVLEERIQSEESGTDGLQSSTDIQKNDVYLE